MGTADKAQDRFCAHDAVNHGKSQCFGCVHDKDFACDVVSEDKLGLYLANREVCPYRELEH